MALELPYGYTNVNPDGSSNVDEKYGHYNSRMEALASVVPAMRKGGRTLGIKQPDGKIVEYWWGNDTDLTDDGLVPKTGDKTYTYEHEQTTPSDIWLIDHPLDKKVSVTVTDSAGTVMEGQITLNTGSQVEIKFNVPFWGYAYLN